MKNWKSVALVVVLNVALFIAGLMCAAEKSPAEEAAEFYKGKTLEFMCSGAPGGGYDTWTRTVAQFLPKYLPVKAVVVINRPAAGGTVVTDQVFRAKGTGGLMILTARAVSTQLAEILGFRATDVRWECMKFNWLCKLTDDVASFGVSPKKFKTMDDVRADDEFLVGVDSMAETSGVRTAIAFEGLGLSKGKIVPGWTGGPERRLATIRGELDGTSGSLSSMLKYYEAGDLRPMWTVSKERVHPKIPAIYELGVKKEAEKWVEWEITLEKIGRTIIAPPDVPKERVEFLRAALAKLLTDPKCQKELKRVRPRDNIVFAPGHEVEQMVKKVMGVSSEDIKKLAYIVMEKYKK